MIFTQPLVGRLIVNIAVPEATSKELHMLFEFSCEKAGMLKAKTAAQAVINLQKLVVFILYHLIYYFVHFFYCFKIAWAWSH